MFAFNFVLVYPPVSSIQLKLSVRINWVQSPFGVLQPTQNVCTQFHKANIRKEYEQHLAA